LLYDLLTDDEKKNTNTYTTYNRSALVRRCKLSKENSNNID